MRLRHLVELEKVRSSCSTARLSCAWSLGYRGLPGLIGEKGNKTIGALRSEIYEADQGGVNITGSRDATRAAFNIGLIRDGGATSA